MSHLRCCWSGKVFSQKRNFKKVCYFSPLLLKFLYSLLTFWSGLLFLTTKTLGKNTKQKGKSKKYFLELGCISSSTIGCKNFWYMCFLDDWQSPVMKKYLTQNKQFCEMMEWTYLTSLLASSNIIAKSMLATVTSNKAVAR